MRHPTRHRVHITNPRPPPTHAPSQSPGAVERHQYCEKKQNLFQDKKSTQKQKTFKNK
jgi:hypothetical protein